MSENQRRFKITPSSNKIPNNDKSQQANNITLHKQNQVFPIEQMQRSENFHINFFSSPLRYLKSLRKNMFTLFGQEKIMKNSCYTNKLQDELTVQDNMIAFFELINGKYEFGLQTQALGLCYFYKWKFNKSFEEYSEKFVIAVCVYLAAKVIQIEKKIPEFCEYQFFCCQSYTPEDFYRLQHSVINLLNFQLQKTTIISFLNFYLTIGIITKTEITLISCSIKQIQQQIQIKGMQYLKSAINFCQDLQLIAIKIIKQVRREHNLQPDNKYLKLMWDKDYPHQKQNIPLNQNSINLIDSRKSYQQKQQKFQRHSSRILLRKNRTSQNNQVQNKHFIRKKIITRQKSLKRIIF